MARKSGSKEDPIPPLEWTAAAIGLLLFLILVGIVAREAIRTPDNPVPQLTVRVDRIVPMEGSHLLTIKVINSGAATAAAVQVEGTLKNGETEVETSGASINYVPGHSQASGGLIFKQDPRKNKLELRVTGYQVP